MPKQEEVGQWKLPASFSHIISSEFFRTQVPVVSAEDEERSIEEYLPVVLSSHFEGRSRAYLLHPFPFLKPFDIMLAKHSDIRLSQN